MGLSLSFASADTCTQPSSQHKGKLSKPPTPSTTPAGRCFLFLSFLSQYGTTCQVQCLNAKHSLFLQHTEGWGIRQVKFCGLQSEFLDYILIKKLSLTDTSRIAYVKNKEAHFSLFTYSVSLVSLPKVAALGQVSGLPRISVQANTQHLSAVSVLSTMGSLPHQPCPCSTSTQSGKQAQRLAAS